MAVSCSGVLINKHQRVWSHPVDPEPDGVCSPVPQT